MGRPCFHRPAPPLCTAERDSVKDINLNISHAWGTPHEVNEPAHPCISWGEVGALRGGTGMGKCIRVSSREMPCGPT